MSELARRIVFSLVAIPIALAAIVIGDWALAALLAVVSALGAWELFRMARAGGVMPLAWLGVPLAGLLPLIVHAHYLRLSPGRVHAGSLGGSALTGPFEAASRAFIAFFTMSLAGAAVLLLVIVAAAIWTRGVSGRPLAAVAVTAFGVAYTGGMLSFGYALRYHEYAIGAQAGTVLVLLPLLLTWTSDTGAYAVGRLAGRRRLIPSVSPGKTVEGSLGGLLLAIIVSWAYAQWVLRPMAQLALTAWSALAFGAVISVAAQLGDLAESLLKREAGVKDSSTLLPGHGGILDRFDSLLFVLPVSYLLLGPLLLPAPR